MSADQAKTDPRVIQSALGQVIRDSSIRDRVAADPELTLSELGLDEDSRACMLSCGARRLLAYHAMAHSRLYRTIHSFMGSAAPRLGDERLHADVRSWIAEHGPRTPYLREVPSEFLSWARPRWDADESLPPWFGELAAHQISIRELRNDPREVGAQSDIKIELERPIACNATTRVVRPRWAVHRLPKQIDPDTTPAPMAEGHALIAYRHVDDKPRFVDIRPRSARLLELLLAGETLRVALFGACEATGETLDDGILSVTAVALADLVDRHVLLGGTQK